MVVLPAHEEITLALGGTVVRLRASLRAAHRLGEPPGLLRHVLELHLGTVRQIIEIAATDRQEAAAFLDRLDRTPLRAVATAITLPLMLFLGSFSPAGDENAKPDPTSKPMAWPEVVATLFRRATGWLGWTPEQAWTATPAEISEAFLGWIEMQRALHPSPDDGQGTAYDPSDKTLDREGLHALKGMGTAR